MLQQLTGVGISLRSRHFNDFLASYVNVSWLEILADQYLGSHGVVLDRLLAITEKYPCSLHAVSLSIGGCDPINQDYLKQLKTIAEKTNAVCVSDHLCWSIIDGQYSHDLLPLMYSQQLAGHIIDRVNQVQDYLQKPFMLENISHYINHPDNYLLEPEMLNTICEKTNCGVLLDVNNIYVSCSNMKIDPQKYISRINPDYVKQYHLAGFTKTPERLIDTHDACIDEDVWVFFQKTIRSVGEKPVCVEWDSDIPELSVMLQEAEKARQIMFHCSENINVIKDKKPLPRSDESLYQLQHSLWQAINNEIVGRKSSKKVHQNSMRMQRLLAISQIYPCCQKVLGKDFFHQQVLQYIVDVPSISPDITNNTDDFLEYLVTDEHPYLVDLAKYERAWYDVFHSVNNDYVDFQSLSEQINKQGDQVVLQHVSGLRFVATEYPVLSIWESCQEEYNGKINNFDKGRYYYVLHQRGGCVVTITLTFSQYQSLARMSKAVSLSAWCDYCEGLKGFDPDFVGGFYKRGLITVINKKEECLL